MLPKQRRTGLFSATQTEELEELARAGLRNPVRVTVRDSNAAAAAAAAAAAVNKSEGGKDSDGDKKKGAAVGSKLPTQLELSYRICESVDAKIFRLAEFLKAKKGRKIIVYFLTCACVDYYQKALDALLDVSSGSKKNNNNNNSSSNKKKKTTKNGNDSRIEIFALHGKMKQAQREQTLENFAENKENDEENGVESSILLTTDVAARGLDIPGVDWIVQFDMPQDPSAFTHRVGRTARMGAKGSALALLTKEESSYVAFLKIRGVYLRRDGNCRFADGDNGDWRRRRRRG
jgi:ATP-dependent RNA helicase DDX55/SPB4